MTHSEMVSQHCSIKHHMISDDQQLYQTSFCLEQKQKCFALTNRNLHCPLTFLFCPSKSHSHDFACNLMGKGHFKGQCQKKTGTYCTCVIFGIILSLKVEILLLYLTTQKIAGTIFNMLMLFLI